MSRAQWNRYEQTGLAESRMHEMGGLLLWLPGCSSTEDIFCEIIWKKHWFRDQQLHLKFGSPRWIQARITLIISVRFLVWRMGIKTATYLYPQTVWALKATCAKAFFLKWKVLVQIWAIGTELTLRVGKFESLKLFLTVFVTTAHS